MIHAIEEQVRVAGRLEDLYVRHAPGALRLAYFLAGDQELAEDLVQDAFVRIAGRFGHRRLPEGFDAYLRRTIVNLFTSHLRRRRLERAWEARHRGPEPVAGPEDPSVRDELFQALLRLPKRQRAAIVLRYYEDLSQQDAADVMRISPRALNALVSRGMATLRKHVRSER
jgi:RNA polymerase sigma factor (sigma-70 family)